MKIICPFCGTENEGKHYHGSIYNDFQRVEFDCKHCNTKEIGVYWLKTDSK